MLGRVKRWVLAMLANAARGSVPGFAAFDPSCAWRSSEPVGTKGAQPFLPIASGAGRTKGRFAEHALTKILTPLPARAAPRSKEEAKRHPPHPGSQKAVWALYGLLRRFPGAGLPIRPAGLAKGARVPAEPVPSPAQTGLLRVYTGIFICRIY
jgi:hypothetical protein